LKERIAELEDEIKNLNEKGNMSNSQKDQEILNLR
jgi:hypothetical protein